MAATIRNSEAASPRAARARAEQHGRAAQLLAPEAADVVGHVDTAATSDDSASPTTSRMAARSSAIGATRA